MLLIHYYYILERRHSALGGQLRYDIEEHLPNAECHQHTIQRMLIYYRPNEYEDGQYCFAANTQMIYHQSIPGANFRWYGSNY